MGKPLREDIKKEAIKAAFNNPEFAKAVAEAVGDNIVQAIREIDSWDFKYEIANLLREAIFTEDFKEELKKEISKYVKENKTDIKELVIENTNKIVIKGVIDASEKIGELLTKKITEINSIY